LLGELADGTRVGEFSVEVGWTGCVSRLSRNITSARTKNKKVSAAIEAAVASFQQGTAVEGDDDLPMNCVSDSAGRESSA
jgi:hypothetical protein